MKRCPDCGTPNPLDGNFCERCGAKLSGGGGGGMEVVVGSSPDCDVVLSSPIVSGHHASFQGRPGGRFLVTDMGSTNGVYVNGQQVQIMEIGQNDRISLGSMWLDLQAVHAALVRKAEPPRPAPVDRIPPTPPPQPFDERPGLVYGPPDSSMNAHTQRRPDPGPSPIYGPPPVHVNIQNLNRQGPNLMPGKIREPFLVILFSILTLGLYTLYWYWVTLDEIRVWRNHQGWGGAMVLLIFVPLVNFIFLAIYFLIPSYIFDLYQSNGVRSPISGPFGFIIFLPMVLVPLGFAALILSGGKLALPLLVLAAIVPAFCSIIWFWRCQSALNTFWRMQLDG